MTDFSIEWAVGTVVGTERISGMLYINVQVGANEWKIYWPLANLIQ